MTAAEWSEGAAGPALRRLTPRQDAVRTGGWRRDYWRPRQASADAIAGAIGGEAHVYHWTDEALCATADPEIFFPEHGDPRAAKRVCGRCPVREECLGYALSHDVTHGVWGGLSEYQRSRLASRRRRAA